MIKSIRLKLTMGYVGTIALLALVFSLFTYAGMRVILTDNLDRSLYTGGKGLEHTLGEYTLKDESDPKSLAEPDEEGGKFFSDDINEEAGEFFPFSTVYIQLQSFTESSDVPPQIVARTSTLQNIALPLSQDARRRIMTDPYSSETVTGVFSFPLRIFSMVVHDRENRPYILQVAMSFQEVKTTLEKLLYTLALTFPILLAVFSVIGFLFMKQVFSPVKKIVSAARNITAEDLTLRLEPIDSRDEIGELADTLNDMISRLEESFRKISQFSGNVSHELKTPLAEIKCNAEVALRKDRSGAEYRQTLQNVIEDTGRLQTTVENLLLLARMDAASITEAFQSVDLSRVFFGIFEETQPLAQKNGISLKFDMIDAVTVQGDTNLLGIAFKNLILNAIQYTQKGGSIAYRLKAEAGHAIFEVSDTGIGIPGNHIAHLFDRFYRVEQSRSRDTGGSGLGLAIVKKVVELHHGKIGVRSTTGQGSTFTVHIPSSP